MDKDKILHIISAVIYNGNGEEMHYIDIDNMMEAYGDITNGEWIYCKDFINAIQELIKQNKQKEEIERLKNDKKKEEQEARIWIKMMNNLIDPKEVSKVIDQELNRLNPTK